MNTKTDGISSGLVAEFWLSIDCIGERYLCFSKPQDDDELYPLVRLSDAEVIISNLSRNDRYGVCDECGTPYSFDPTDGGTICVKCQKDKIAQKDAEILEQCRLNGMGAEREAALLGQIERQSAALKLAREALIGALSDDQPYINASKEALAAIDALKGE